MTPRSWAVLACILSFSAALVLPTLEVVKIQQRADEGYYLKYATRVAQEGLGAFPKLFQDYLTGASVHQYFPPPSRLVTVALQAGAVSFPGSDARNLQILSLLAFLALLVLVFVSLVQSMGEGVAGWATFLLSVSPLHLYLARRALSDSLVALFLVGSLILFIRVLTAEKSSSKLWWGVSVLYALTFLSKEAAVVLIPLSMALLLWKGVWSRFEGIGFPILCVSLLPLGAALLLLAVCAGGFGTAWKVLVLSVSSGSTNPYASVYGSGPWFRYLVDFILLSPCVTLLYLGWCGFLLMQGKDQPESVKAWAWIPFLFMIFSAPASKDVRYALFLETPIRLGAVLFLRDLTMEGRAFRSGLLWMAVAVAGIALGDLLTTANLFVAGGLYDPVTYQLLLFRRLIPP
ncbi:MAG: glycosyltransferase family 39 protein [Candidatus Omnitrophica bacterium]|nr:glycosyltransferase family 39 protein [Candidatus Omnitrophota bacterium]